jgi:hypothetical protein
LCLKYLWEPRAASKITFLLSAAVPTHSFTVAIGICLNKLQTTVQSVGADEKKRKRERKKKRKKELRE